MSEIRLCDATVTSEGFECTRPADHDGAHVASMGPDLLNGDVADVWLDMPRFERLLPNEPAYAEVVQVAQAERDGWIS